jgi:hypothetical protein
MKRLVFFLTLAALVFGCCRKEADDHPYIGEFATSITLTQFTQSIPMITSCCP